MFYHGIQNSSSSFIKWFTCLPVWHLNGGNKRQHSLLPHPISWKMCTCQQIRYILNFQQKLLVSNFEMTAALFFHHTVSKCFIWSSISSKRSDHSVGEKKLNRNNIGKVPYMTCSCTRSGRWLQYTIIVMYRCIHGYIFLTKKILNIFIPGQVFSLNSSL